ncbi:hypothetical protein GL58_18780 [Comamonas testosteroni]|uniref:Uncharacterized protein n=1 Tax=Comamonas testosteroni TaxID=285 RepID=A0A0L7MBH5_COMTE|nr:hypothetical protein [Comamonas testosteroni]KOC19252.1 hypothetical protein GL58_18780 [Comamonas testosteroni]KWT72898.1 hypothetical protein APV28_1462 [Comamonas testosteroni]
MTVFLQFIDEAAAAAALSPWSADGAIPAYIGSAAVDVIGVIQRPTGEVLQTEAGEIPVLAPVPGWHINLSARVPELEQYEVGAPATPDRVFAGIDVVVPPRVPSRVTRRQARQALALAGLFAAVQPAINAIPDPQQRQLAQIEWDDSQDFERERPLLIELGHAIGLDDAGIDELFIQAGAL